MTVVCIDNSFSDSLQNTFLNLTIGRHYTVISSSPFNNSIKYVIMNDVNQRFAFSLEYKSYGSRFFITLEEYRNNQLDKIL